MNAQLKSKVIISIILIVVMVVSFFLLAGKMSVPETYENSIEYLGEKEKQVFVLTSSAVVASTALSFLPGDDATPLANELMNMVEFFGIVLGAIVVERYCLTAIGYIVFRIIIPIGCITAILGLFVENKSIQLFAKKLLIYGLILFLMVPSSVRLAQMIDEVQGFSTESTVNLLEDIPGVQVDDQNTEIDQSQEENQGKKGGLFKKKPDNQNSAEAETESQLGIKDAISGAIHNAFSFLGNCSEVIVEKSQEAMNAAKNLLNDILEKLVILFVTACIMPLFVIILFLWATKGIMGIEVPMPTRLPKPSGNIVSRIRNEYDD